MSLAKESLKLTGLFEAELLIELMLRQWDHPHAANPVFRASLLENSAEVLQLAVNGTSLIEGLKPERMNLVAAIWCAEASALDRVEGEWPKTIEQRKIWVDAVRRAVPSCFCDPELLD
jgi:hypothetical protein